MHVYDVNYTFHYALLLFTYHTVHVYKNSIWQGLKILVEFGQNMSKN